jgi:hypothetical protein
MKCRTPRPRTVVAAVLFAVAVVLPAACANDGDDDKVDGIVDAGTGGGSVGGSAYGGTGANTSGGSSGSSGGASGNASGGSRAGASGGVGGKEPIDASIDGSERDSSAPVVQEDAAPRCDAYDAGDTTPGNLLFVTGSYIGCGRCGTNSEIFSVDLERGCILGRESIDLDLMPVASNGRGFLFEGGDLSVLTPNLRGLEFIDTTAPLAKPWYASPAGLTYAGGPAGKGKVYVYYHNYVYRDQNAIEPIDLETGQVTSVIELTAFRDPDDAQSFASVEGAFYDAATSRAYFVLRRGSVFATERCPTLPGALIAIDASTDQLIDLNGSADGMAVALSLNPESVVFDKGARRLYVTGDCFGTDGGLATGVESINVDTLTGQLIQTSTERVPYLTLLGADSAVLQAWDGVTFTARLWTPSSNALGAPLEGYPWSGAVEGPDSVIGVTITENKAQVYRYQISTHMTAPVVDFTFNKFNGSSAAIVVKAPDR